MAGYKKKLRECRSGFTFDDVLLVPAPSEVEPADTDITSKLTEKITLHTPLISAAMDTVTEFEMAIAMAQIGGAGVIHKNMSIQKQCEMVKKVKKYESFIIRDVKVIYSEQRVCEAKKIMDEYKITGLPVLDVDGNLCGILTLRDLRFVDNMDLRVEDVMTHDVVTVDESITISEACKILQKHKIEKLPVIDNNRRLVGMITVKDIRKKLDFPDATRDCLGHLIVLAAVGPQDFKRAELLANAGADAIVVDCAHAHNKSVVRFVRKLTDKIDCEIIAGNIATGDAAEDLISAGANSLKVGIGAGSICTTRIIAGIGVPQLSAISSVADVAEDYGIPVIADGGIKYSGDIVKAIAAGADVVMLGNLLAGTKESPGRELLIGGRKFKEYRGMGSLAAMKVDASRYFQRKSGKFVPEGVEGAVPYSGTVNDVIFQLIGGLRAGMGYTGARTIEELKKNTKFIKITSGGLMESHPHSIFITNEAPNYTQNLR